MSLEKFAPRDIPFQASSNLREYLDNEMRRIQVLLNNAAQLEDELIPDSLLSPNVALLDRDPQTFTGKITFTGNSGNLFGNGGLIIETQVPNVIFKETDQAAGSVAWSWGVGTRNFRLMALEDNLDAGPAPISVVRESGGTNIDLITLTADAIALESDVEITGDLFLEQTNPRLWFKDTTAASNEGGWLLQTGDDNFNIQTRNDADTSGQLPLTIIRTGTIVDEIELTATLLDFNGVLDLAGHSILFGSFASIQGSSHSVSDDATASIVLPNSAIGGLFLVTAQTTGGTPTNDWSMFYILASTTAPAELHVGAAGITSFGTGVNPDVDGDVNIWMNPNGTLNIKNRRGSTRRFNVYILTA